MNAPKDKKKLIVIAVIVVLVLLNIIWTVMQNKFAPKVDEITKAIAALEQRIVKLEQGGLSNVAELKEDFAAMKTLSENLTERLNHSIKTEEEELAHLEAQVAAQKAHIEALKQAAK